MHVIFSDQSLDDLREIFAFVSDSSDAAAERLILELVRRSEELSESSRLYGIVDGYESLGIRRRNVRTWAIFYRERETFVDIVRIVHGGRDIAQLNLGR